MKKAGSLFTSAYLLIIFGIYPFYMENGYVNLGEAKARFFLAVSLAAAGILALLWIVNILISFGKRSRTGQAYLIEWEKISVTDLFVLMYATEVFLSYVFTDYREEALWGTKGWFMGTVLLLLLCVLYFEISRFFKGGKIIFAVALAASGAVFLIGILDRFSIYPLSGRMLFSKWRTPDFISVSSRQPDFISTLGNINWFCGYLSVLAPIGIGLFFFCRNKKEKWLLGLYTVVAFMAGFCQGSSSVLLFFGALFYFLLWIAVKKKCRLEDFFLTLSLWGLAGQLVRLLRFFMPEAYNYDTENICGTLTSSAITLVTGIAAFFIYLALHRRGKKLGDGKEKEPGGKEAADEEAPGDGETLAEGVWERRVHRAMLFVPAVCLVSWFVLSLINTRTGIPGLSEKESFLLNENWGNGRGRALSAGFWMFWETSLLHKLFGIGSDCFSQYAYSIPELAAALRNSFGSVRLTNAHNEILTGLVNTGILGISLYLGIFISFIKRGMKKGKEQPDAYIAPLCAFCYLAHNLVSFAQVLNLTFLFLLLGIGEGVLRKDENKNLLK